MPREITKEGIREHVIDNIAKGPDAVPNSNLRSGMKVSIHFRSESSPTPKQVVADLNRNNFGTT